MQLDNWINYVNTPQTQKELDKIRGSVNKQVPIGSKNWVITVVQKYGLLSTLKVKGRPKHEKKL